MTKRLLVMAGGTGGHVFPGLAVAHDLQNEGWDIHWLGTKDRMEASLVPKNGFQIHFIDVAGVRGNGIVRLLKAPFMIAKSVFQACKIMREFKPHVVLGMGGFASGPGGLAAWLLGTPLILHEQNAVPGLTNKVLAPLARKVLTAFQVPTWKLNKDKKQLVGNPVREEFAHIAPLESFDRPVNILISGGSLGAKALNDHVPSALSQLSGTEFRVVHQAGKGKADEVITCYQALDIPADHWQVHEFLDNIVDSYAWADIVICRAGALTVSEIALAGRCAIFVPLPHAVDDHQTKNAESLTKTGAAILLPQAQLENGELLSELRSLIANQSEIIKIAHLAKKQGERKATKMVSSVCKSEAVEKL